MRRREGPEHEQKTTRSRQAQQNRADHEHLITYRFHVVFNSEDQCLFQLPEFVVWCRRVREERAQTLPSGIIDLREVEP